MDNPLTTGCEDDGDELSLALRQIEPARLNEILRQTLNLPYDLRFEPVAPCGECGVDTETYYHLPTCSMSEDIVGVGV